MEFDYEAEVDVGFAEDLTFAEVAPILDAFAATPIFKVTGTRVGYSGPAGGGPDLGLIITAVAAAGGAAFAGSFCSELAKDVYKGVRGAILAVLRSLRDRDPEHRRAGVGLMIEVREIRICVGPRLWELGPDELTDEWLVVRLLEAQAIVERVDDVVEREPGTTCDYWAE